MPVGMDTSSKSNTKALWGIHFQFNRILPLNILENNMSRISVLAMSYRLLPKKLQSKTTYFSHYQVTSIIDIVCQHPTTKPKIVGLKLIGGKRKKVKKKL